MWWELATHRGGNIQGGIAWGGIISGVALYSIARCGFECGAAISSCLILRVSYNKGVHLIPRNKKRSRYDLTLTSRKRFMGVKQDIEEKLAPQLL